MLIQTEMYDNNLLMFNAENTDLQDQCHKCDALCLQIRVFKRDHRTRKSFSSATTIHTREPFSNLLVCRALTKKYHIIGLVKSQPIPPVSPWRLNFFFSFLLFSLSLSLNSYSVSVHFFSLGVLPAVWSRVLGFLETFIYFYSRCREKRVFSGESAALVFERRRARVAHVHVPRE